MIQRISKGRSFGGCVRYVCNKPGADLIGGAFGRDAELTQAHAERTDRTWAVAERTALESEKRAPDDADEALDIARLAVRMAELILRSWRESLS